MITITYFTLYPLFHHEGHEEHEENGFDADTPLALKGIRVNLGLTCSDLAIIIRYFRRWGEALRASLRPAKPQARVSSFRPCS